jgi:hypothetical protein
MANQTWKELLTDPQMFGFWVFIGLIGAVASLMGAWVFSMIWNDAAWSAM